MSCNVKGNYELEDVHEEGEEEDLRSPLVLDQSKLNTSNLSTFFKFPSSPRSILKSAQNQVSPRHSIFLTVPGGNIAPLPSPILLPASTPAPPDHSQLHKVSFYGQSDTPPADQTVSYQAQFNTTKYKRTQYLSNLLLILTDGLLPLVSIVSTLINVLELFLTEEMVLGCVGLVIFSFPTALVLFYYLENMFHREKKLMEMGLILIFGPFLRWLCSVRLISTKLRPTSDVGDLKDIQRFSFATKIIDGIFQASVQIIWLLYLIAIEVYPFPLLNMRTKSVTDWFGNNLQIPVVSSLSLYTSLAVLVKNLSQLWRIHYPVSTNQSGSETVELNQTITAGSLKTLLQWFILILFTSTGVFYRLIGYTLLFLHLNVFFMPAGGIMIFSTILHIVLRGVSNRFYVETSKMDVFLTACCCCLVPTPTSSNIRAHNLLQAHTAITNILLLFSLCACVFLSTDYSVPIVRRPSRLVYSSQYFFNYILLGSFLLPISTLFYLFYKKTMSIAGLTRKTIFWKNRKPTVVSVCTVIVSLILLTSLTFLNIQGRNSSSQCQDTTSPIEHGLLLSQGSGHSHGSRLDCHKNYRPFPADTIYCSSFFGKNGVIEMVPLYYQELISKQTPNLMLSTEQTASFAETVAFVRDLDSVSCVKRNMTIPSCQSSSISCNVSSLLSTFVPYGSWQCAGQSCALFCQPGYLSTGPTIHCAADQKVPLHYCHLAALAGSNTTYTEVLSPEGDCEDTIQGNWKETESLDPIFICKNVSDILLPGTCLSLDPASHHPRFMSTSNSVPSRLHVSYPPLPLTLAKLMNLAGQPLSLTQEEFSFKVDKECVVKLSHDTILIVGEITLLVRIGSNLSYVLLPPLNNPRYSHSCSLLDERRVLVAGGRGMWINDLLEESEVMDITSPRLEWRKMGRISHAREKGTILTVNGGCPLLVGGLGKEGQQELTVEEFHLHSDGNDGNWLEVSLEFSFRSSINWSVALCGVNNCTGEKFSHGQGDEQDRSKEKFSHGQGDEQDRSKEKLVAVMEEVETVDKTGNSDDVIEKEYSITKEREDTPSSYIEHDTSRVSTENISSSTSSSTEIIFANTREANDYGTFPLNSSSITSTATESFIFVNTKDANNDGTFSAESSNTNSTATESFIFFNPEDERQESTSTFILFNPEEKGLKDAAFESTNSTTTISPILLTTSTSTMVISGISTFLPTSSAAPESTFIFTNLEEEKTPTTDSILFTVQSTTKLDSSTPFFTLQPTETETVNIPQEETTESFVFYPDEANSKADEIDLSIFDLPPNYDDY